MSTRRTRLLVLVLAAAAVIVPAQAGPVMRTVTYFDVGGDNLEEIEKELDRRGPKIAAAGPRHPGATRMEFVTSVTYGEGSGRCGVLDVEVELKANMILPRWRTRRDHDQSVRLVWDTLAADIRRHEESHVVIARNHAREIEMTVENIRNAPDCDAAATRVKAASAEILARHDEAQARFDRTEAINFESRMMRLLHNRLERLENAGEPG